MKRTIKPLNNPFTNNLHNLHNRYINNPCINNQCMHNQWFPSIQKRTLQLLQWY